MLVGTSTSCWLATTFFFFVFCFVCTSLKALVRSASALTLGPDGPGAPTHLTGLDSGVGGLRLLRRLR